MRKDAVISECGKYRYTLSRHWGDGAHVLFCLLNPSTADANQEDPTLRRGIGFARQWGFDGVVFVNLFAYRATDPADMLAAEDPVGPENDKYILQEAERADFVVMAYGAHGKYKFRDRQVISLLRNFDMRCLERTKN